MMKLLVVDDVAIIADGLYELFSREWKDRMAVYRAYSVPEAFDILEDVGIDIVVTDIRMPQYTGIELLKRINERWPACKVIFLTSYHDFDFAREAVTLGGYDFILKTEGDDRIIQSVNSAANELRQQREAQQWMASAQARYKLALPALRLQFLQELLQGMHADAGARQAQFRDLEMPFRQEEPAFLAIARMDEWKQATTWTDKALLMYAVNNVLDEYLSGKVRMIAMDMGPSHLAVIWQPDDGANRESARGAAFRQFYGTLETVQNTCREMLKLPISFILGSVPSPWETLGQQLQRLELLLQSGIGLNSELLTTDAELLSRKAGEHEAEEPAEAAADLPMKRFSLLADLLAGGHKDAFFTLFDELDEMVDRTNGALGPKLEAIYFLASSFLQYMNRRKLLTRAAARFGMDNWLPVEEDPDWSRHAEFYRGLAGFLFECASDEREHGSARLVQDVQQYVSANLGSDLSLTRLGEHVHLNPTYLSRLYKQMTGIGISEYIMEVRMAKAIELLERSHCKIHEIAEAVGYQSGIAFNRFFKRVMNISPQDYRRMRVERFD